MKKHSRIIPSLLLIILAVLFIVGTVGVDHWSHTPFNGEECVATLHTEHPDAPFHDYMLLASGEIDVHDGSAWMQRGSIHGSLPEDLRAQWNTIFPPACSIAYSAESERGPVLLVTTKRGTVYYSFNWGKDWDVQGNPELAALYREFRSQTE